MRSTRRISYGALLLLLAACGKERKLDPRGSGKFPMGLGGASTAGNGGFGGGAGRGTAVYASGGGSGISDCPPGGGGGVGGGGGIGGGAGGRGGAGGSSDPVCPPPTLPDCVGGGPACGDGKAEVCLRPAQVGFCPKYPVVQACDGADHRQQTCRDQGFGSGTLACSPSCTFDVRGCRECTTDVGVVRCGDAPVGAAPRSALAVAATDAEIALAWAEPYDDRPPTLHFARFDTNLDVVSAAALDDPAFNAASGGFGGDVTIGVEPLASGWVVAGYAAPDVFVHAVDARGRGVGRITVDRIPIGAATMPPILAGRPGGGPLLLWERSGVVRASVVSADGGAATPPIALGIDPSMTTGRMSAAFVGDAFYVAVAVYDDVTKATSAHLRLVRVTADGTSATAVDALPGAEVRQPQIVGGAVELHIAYDGRVLCAPGYHKLAQRVSTTGVALASAVRLADHQRGLLAAGPIAVGSDTASLLLGFGRESLTVVRNAPDGTPAGSARVVALGPLNSFDQAHIARRGPDLVVAWTTHTRPGIQLALVTP